MIVDKSSNILFYQNLLPGIKEGMRALEGVQNIETLVGAGKREFEGGFFTVCEGTTKPLEEGLFETHKNYIDVQIIIKGAEEVAVKDAADLEVVTSYDKDKDICILDGDKSHSIRVSEGMFYAVFPHDGHAPGCYTKNPESFLKVVMKLRAN